MFALGFADLVRSVRTGILFDDARAVAAFDELRCSEPELRRRGYATALVAALSQPVLDDGRAFLPLHRSREPRVEFDLPEGRLPRDRRLPRRRLRARLNGAMTVARRCPARSSSSARSTVTRRVRRARYISKSSERAAGPPFRARGSRCDAAGSVCSNANGATATPTHPRTFPPRTMPVLRATLSPTRLRIGEMTLCSSGTSCKGDR
jgi:hypothetical protein